MIKCSHVSVVQKARTKQVYSTPTFHITVARDALTEWCLLNAMMIHVIVDSSAPIENFKNINILMYILCHKVVKAGDCRLVREYLVVHLLCNILERYLLLILILVRQGLRSIANLLVLIWWRLRRDRLLIQLIRAIWQDL